MKEAMDLYKVISAERTDLSVLRIFLSSTLQLAAHFKLRQEMLFRQWYVLNGQWLNSLMVEVQLNLLIELQVLLVSILQPLKWSAFMRAQSFLIMTLLQTMMVQRKALHHLQQLLQQYRLHKLRHLPLDQWNLVLLFLMCNNQL